MENNITKFLKKDSEQTFKIINYITKYVNCCECPALKFCNNTLDNNKHCVDTFKNWALKED